MSVSISGIWTGNLRYIRHDDTEQKVKGGPSEAKFHSAGSSDEKSGQCDDKSGQ